VPDWLSLVRGHLAARHLASDERDEIATELASHLEEIYEAHRANGVSEPEAALRTRTEVPNWRVLARRIENARCQEGFVNHRTMSVWIPGLVSLTLASGLLALLQDWGVPPHIVWTRSGLALLFYIPWLVAQPIFGAVAAYISRKNGGAWHERLTASLIPAAGMVGAFCVAVCAAIALNLTGDGHEINAIALSLYVLSWAAVPGLTLALGALPFLGGVKLDKRADMNTAANASIG
jgi:hypothetical protein